ncbi:hypothetical protein MA16_Dca012802 [Dendrobium catenatum]|uniref:Uncharacterized protein n=1 Tax=Dendrobium catenatum TaxID=906689 RepID=A0A2I0V7U1_9ASPA|nr:hypothetical protein MA16_Dca012802 [Dendrobium catenatum]
MGGGIGQNTKKSTKPSFLAVRKNLINTNLSLSSPITTSSSLLCYLLIITQLPSFSCLLSPTMASQTIENHREGAEIYKGDELCKKKSIELLEELCLPKGLFPLEDIE